MKKVLRDTNTACWL